MMAQAGARRQQGAELVEIEPGDGELAVEKQRQVELRAIERGTAARDADTRLLDCA
jgi:hypothetical protein